MGAPFRVLSFQGLSRLVETAAPDQFRQAGVPIVRAVEILPLDQGVQLAQGALGGKGKPWRHGAWRIPGLTLRRPRSARQGGYGGRDVQQRLREAQPLKPMRNVLGPGMSGDSGRGPERAPHS